MPVMRRSVGTFTVPTTAELRCREEALENRRRGVLQAKKRRARRRYKTDEISSLISNGETYLGRPLVECGSDDRNSHNFRHAAACAKHCREVRGRPSRCVKYSATRQSTSITCRCIPSRNEAARCSACLGVDILLSPFRITFGIRPSVTTAASLRHEVKSRPLLYRTMR